MNFLEAIKAHQDDKKVTHKNYPGACLHLISSTWMLLDKINNIRMWVNPDLMLSDDWYVVEESKDTLWDKNLEMFNSNMLEADDVKEFLNDFIDWLINEESYGKMVNFEERVRNKAKEIFGEELLK